MSRHVRGTLFVDYVRMLRAQKSVNWSNSATLTLADVDFLNQRIDPEQWYPMESFERMGLTILKETGIADMLAVREWGRISADAMLFRYPELLVPSNPRASLLKFHTLRSGFFDFSVLVLRNITDTAATFELGYQMGDLAEEAASNQTMGFFDRLLELAGARERKTGFGTRSWAGEAATTIEMGWQLPES